MKNKDTSKEIDLLKHASVIIKKLREMSNGGKGISQSELGRQIGENSNTISRWETGEYKPTIVDIWNLSRFFNVPISVFFNRNENSNELRVMMNKFLTKQDKEEIVNFIQFKIWMRSPDRKKIGRKRSGDKS
ncbi:DNA-binding helix-turn-helix protein [Leptospira interrogans serovar Valbuzzi str. Duyster]|uniref:helix-turn-helix transcriptional regulator n=1 Tax=Leptospira interrogans TaxID=173 RepID=UPI0002BA0FFB|nr:helix-turn-helix transcriptional regulator [Leptospira interrogans]EMJ52070.1 DNA-binding helix-turn-helix protein [Leptospira interrogans serovar Valbuzzi str. Duyster]EMJ53639.1 DNA-binding helix-turn-helix protein [Leptospira interrogans serovar Valbuzzi str. Duyster]EMJ54766.1 DNA-binding helix-turn-helix protein [Leptospira interrogans serovar Valbuzzi str. Duyster]EMJ54830.1 DNA-binding helix-turn-helix protein [Leptospira interrogans serovar Valbuzzi str. Duyster]EMJ55380.1 DNA-bindi